MVLVYNVIFKLKVPSGYSSNDTVANLEVHLYDWDVIAETWNDSVLVERLIIYDDSFAGQYYPFTLTFERPPYNSRDSFDYKVYWYKQTDLYIDYVEVYDHIYDSLFNVKYLPDTTYTVYQWKLINDPNIKPLEEQFGDSSLYRWCLQDEPDYDQYRSSKRVHRILDSVHYAPGIQATGDFIFRNTYRYLDELYPYPNELFYDDYPIIRDRTPENNNEAWQATLDSFAVRVSKVANAAETKGKEWWYGADAYWEALYPDIYRYPHNNELKATVYMALAYGAKGVGYFRYASYWRNDSLIHGGLVDTSGIPVQTYPYPENQYYAGTHEYLFDAVKQINEKLDVLGPVLRKLEWKWAGPGDSVLAAPESFVGSVTGVACINCGFSCKYPVYSNYVQVGMFKDDSLGEDYLMLVNRWVGYLEMPCERVTLQKSRYFYLIDCLTGGVVDTFPGYGIFHTILNPGEGKLFRLANFLPSNLSGSRQSSPQRINLSWSDPNVNESGYEVWRKLADGANWSQIGSTDSNVTSYSDTTLVGSETYNYRVRAFDQQYFSEYSNEVTVKNFPNPPRNLTARLNRICCPGFGSVGGMSINGICPYCYTNEIILSWQPPLNQKAGTLTQYKVTAIRGSWTQSQTVPATSTSTIFCVPELGKSYNFKVYAIDYASDLSNPSNTVSIVSGTTNNCFPEDPEQRKITASSVVPEKFELFQNYPNPFNFGTIIKYALAEESQVKLVVYNLLGQKIRVLVDETQSPAYYTIFWDGTNDRGEEVASGIYFYRMQTGTFTKTAKMSLLK